MKYCPKCGHQNNDNVRSCANCAYSFDGAKKKKPFYKTWWFITIVIIFAIGIIGNIFGISNEEETANKDTHSNNILEFSETNKPNYTTASPTAEEVTPTEEPSSAQGEAPTKASTNEPLITPTHEPTVPKTAKPTTPPTPTLHAATTHTANTATPAPTLQQATHPATNTPASICFVTYPKTIGRNNTATVTIQGQPNTKYSISVMYSSGKSKAKGLEDKISDASGLVTWTWRIGGNTAFGTFTITVSGSGQTGKVEFTVVE